MTVKLFKPNGLPQPVVVKGEGDVCIMRPSKWGNPFHIGEVVTERQLRNLCITVLGYATPVTSEQMQVEFPEIWRFIERGGTCTRKEVLKMFQEWLHSLMNKGIITSMELRGLSGKKLGCCCKPKPCHGDIIVKTFVEFTNGKKFPSNC